MKNKTPRHKTETPINRILKNPVEGISRNQERLEERKKILIYCEGKNTEPSYFNKFRLTTAVVKAYGEGRNTFGLVKKAVSLKDGHDEVWCVFDLDVHGKENFNKAIKLAESEGLFVAYSIQAFEYWLLLHFENHQGGAMERSQYNSKLNFHLKRFGCKYDGRGDKLISREFFELMIANEERGSGTRQEKAIKRAEKIFKSKDPTNPANGESCTTVYRLVQKLIQAQN